MAVFSTIYFYQRESYMLEWNEIIVSQKIGADLLLLQIQFLTSLLALNMISIIFLISIYKYMSYKEYKGEIDELTGIMGRRMFLYHCEHVENGWFLFVDAVLMILMVMLLGIKFCEKLQCICKIFLEKMEK